MSIYQEEMMRKLPKLGCTGTLDEATGTLSIRQNGVFLCQQLVDGTLLYMHCSAVPRILPSEQSTSPSVTLPTATSFPRSSSV